MELRVIADEVTSSTDALISSADICPVSFSRTSSSSGYLSKVSFLIRVASHNKPC
jgi:hypothetical protein